MADDSERIRKFFAGVIKASKRREERNKVRSSLGKQVEKVQALASQKKVKKGIILKALKDLDKKFLELIEKENKAIALQSGIQQKLSSFTTKDVQLISSLKEKIEQFEEKEESKINSAVTELKSKIDELESIESERNRRIFELESKIKQQVNETFVEIMRLEQDIEQMEAKYRRMKSEKKIGRKQLESFKAKIQALKGNLVSRKRRLIEEEMKKGAPLPVAPAEFKFTKKPETKLLQFVPREAPQEFSVPKSMIRHDVRIEPVGSEERIPQPPAPLAESFENILGDESIPVMRLRRDISKKKSFFAKLFG
jgi:chromosome segregation ATPase